LCNRPKEWTILASHPLHQAWVSVSNLRRERPRRQGLRHSIVPGTLPKIMPDEHNIQRGRFIKGGLAPASVAALASKAWAGRRFNPTDLNLIPSVPYPRSTLAHNALDENCVLGPDGSATKFFPDIRQDLYFFWGNRYFHFGYPQISSLWRISKVWAKKLNDAVQGQRTAWSSVVVSRHSEWRCYWLAPG
jgi:hypothetical protein